MDEVSITKENRDARHGRYVARIKGIDAEGEITFTRRGEGVISADHTGVPDAMGGKGVAKALLNFMLDVRVFSRGSSRAASRTEKVASPRRIGRALSVSASVPWPSSSPTR